MNKHSLSRRSFLKTVAKTTAALVLAGVAKWIPETQAAMAGQKLLGDEVEFVTLDVNDPRVTTLRNHSQLKSSKFARDINWSKAYLQRRKSPSTSEALVVAFNQRKGETETRFLVVQVDDVHQQPVVVSISPDGPISPKGLSGIILVYGLDGKVLKRINIKDGQVDANPSAGKAPGLARERPNLFSRPANNLKQTTA